MAGEEIRTILDDIHTAFTSAVSGSSEDDCMLAADLGYNKNYFCKLFKQNLGMPFLQYVNEYRIRYAIIWYREYPLTQIAGEIGFKDYNYFARVFKKYTGMTPHEYFRDP